MRAGGAASRAPGVGARPLWLAGPHHPPLAGPPQNTSIHTFIHTFIHSLFIVSRARAPTCPNVACTPPGKARPSLRAKGPAKAGGRSWAPSRQGRTDDRLPKQRTANRRSHKAPLPTLRTQEREQEHHRCQVRASIRVDPFLGQRGALCAPGPPSSWSRKDQEPNGRARKRVGRVASGAELGGLPSDGGGGAECITGVRFLQPGRTGMSSAHPPMATCWSEPLHAQSTRARPTHSLTPRVAAGVAGRHKPLGRPRHERVSESPLRAQEGGASLASDAASARRQLRDCPAVLATGRRQRA